MKISGNFRFIYKNTEDAKLAFDSLEIDNENYLKSKINDNFIDYQIESEKLGSFLNTIDDLVASEIVVEKIITETKVLYK